MHPLLKQKIKQQRDAIISYTKQLDPKADAELRLEAIALVRKSDCELEQLEAMANRLRNRVYGDT